MAIFHPPSDGKRTDVQPLLFFFLPIKKASLRLMVQGSTSPL
ncbi:hypothetical protein NBRC111894_279 [Sporolactobacillus inulinus]|uniref:Uncharacterized protein n=1 Tax=Sporolactobacillus inulinus TaxID=2078 RepID=A0A4Y1Z6R0_9BACL|nr:hypothetical protein NBRC111894_279 [Sporolactobacillus inulinus]